MTAIETGRLPKEAIDFAMGDIDSLSRDAFAASIRDALANARENHEDGYDDYRAAWHYLMGRLHMDQHTDISI